MKPRRLGATKPSLKPLRHDAILYWYNLNLTKSHYFPTKTNMPRCHYSNSTQFSKIIGETLHLAELTLLLISRMLYLMTAGLNPSKKYEWQAGHSHTYSFLVEFVAGLTCSVPVAVVDVDVDAGC